MSMRFSVPAAKNPMERLYRRFQRSNEARLADLRVELRTSVAELRTDIAAVRGDMMHRSEMTEMRREMADLRKEIGGVRSDMAHRSDVADFRGEMADLRRDMNERFVAVDQKFTWLGGIQVAGLIAVIGALVGSYYR